MWVTMWDKTIYKKSPCKNKGLFKYLAEAVIVKLRKQLIDIK